MGLSLHLDFGGHGFKSGFCFLGVGSVYLKLGFVWGVGLDLLLLLRGLFFLKGFFLSSFFLFCCGTSLIFV